MATPAADRTVADRHVLKTPLGRGGMGVVWHAHDTAFVQTFQPDRVLLMPDGAVDVWSEDYLDLVALD